VRLVFRTSLAPTIALIVLVPAFVALGFWQLNRAVEKQHLQEQYDVRTRDAVVFVGAQILDPNTVRFYRVTATGDYEPNRTILIDNRVHKGVAGYHVVTPLRIRGSEMRVLVNRGWIPVGPSRATLPSIATPAGEQQIDGIAVVPLEHAFTLREPPPLSPGRWQTLWQHLDLKRFRDGAGIPLQPVVILLDPASPAGGFTREWSRLDAGIAVHQAYAFQWFTLAVAALGLYFILGHRAGKQGQPGTDPDKNAHN